MIIVSLRAIKLFEYILGHKGVRGIAFFPFIFIRTIEDINDVIVNHEKIHLRQQLELCVIPFYVWYLIALYRVGYSNISFEREAYANEKDFSYLKKRTMFSFMKYLTKMK